MALIGIFFLCGVLIILKLSAEEYDPINKQYYKDVWFAGIIKGIDNGCHADGTCALIVNNVPVIYAYGWGGCDERMGAVLLKGIEGRQYVPSYTADALVGKRVVVYARRITGFRNAVGRVPEGEETTTLCGNKSYYIREF